MWLTRHVYFSGRLITPLHLPDSGGCAVDNLPVTAVPRPAALQLFVSTARVALATIYCIGQGSQALSARGAYHSLRELRNKPLVDVLLFECFEKHNR